MKKTTKTLNEQSALRATIRRLLREADEDTEDTEAPGAEASDEPESKGPMPKPTAMDEGLSIDNQIDEILDGYEAERTDDTGFDAEGYAIDVFNLIENYANLLEVQSTFTKRAAKRIKDHIDEATSKAFVKAMDDQHGITIDKATGETSDEFVAPVGQGGGPDVGGGMGGGGAPV